MFRTLCAIAWDVPLPFLILLFLVVCAAALFAAPVARPEVRRLARKTGLALCALGVIVFFGSFWFSGTVLCRVGRVVREQVSHDYVSHHFACEAEDRTLRGVSRAAAQRALAQCDEDHWDAITQLWDGSVVHDVLQCRAAGLELWADHFQRTNGQHDWDACFTACRAGKCAPLTIITHDTE